MANEIETGEILQGTELFSAKMRDRLIANLGKGGWKDKSSAYLLRRLLEEVAELVEALDEGTQGEIEEEAVDVANFAMMIGDPKRIANMKK